MTNRAKHGSPHRASSRTRARATYLVASVATREQRHRRALLIAVSALLVLSTAPIFGHHVANGAHLLLEGRDHFGALCLIALHYLLEPVHGGFHLLVAAGLLLAAADRLRAWYRVRRVMAGLDARTPVPGDLFWGAAEAAWLDPRRVRIVSGLPNPAFTVGWLRPMVYVSEALAERLALRELTAVLAHEAAHLRRRDPLRLTAIRFLARTLFWLPVLSRLADDLADEAEIAADDAAAGGRPLALASALVAIASTFGQSASRDPLREAVVAAWSARGGDLLERRVRRLAGEDVPVHSHLTRRSVATAALAMGMVLSSSIAVVHPLPEPAPGVVAHCTHHHGWAISHLFCRGGNAAGHHGHHDPQVCPHQPADG